MYTFHLQRDEDASGISGTGIVAEGIVFNTGKVALSWLSNLNSIAIYNSIEDVAAIHGHGGKTKVVEDYSPYGEWCVKHLTEPGTNGCDCKEPTVEINPHCLKCTHCECWSDCCYPGGDAIAFAHPSYPSNRGEN